MEHQEKKYLVDGLTPIQQILDTKGAVKIDTIYSIHYYAQQEGNNVTKLVSYTDRNEIHELHESQGSYSLTETIPVSSKYVGLKSLKNKGYTTVAVISMSHTDYTYKNGTVGLYVLDAHLFSVILDYPKTDLTAMENEFGLDASRVISVPYDKYLASINRITLIKLT